MLTQAKQIIRRNIPFGLTAILGISFWFFLAFPFGNHNESYEWISIFKTASLHDILTKTIRPVVTFRPLAQATAYLAYKLSGGSIYYAELLNYFLAALSWIIVSFKITEKKIFSITSLLVGGFFFSGYIYLFHLHGVFYSPVLLLISLLFLVFEYSDNPNNKKYIIAFLLAILASFFHPFALLLFVAYFTGLLIEQRRALSRRYYVTAAFIILLTLSGILIFKGQNSYPITTDNVAGLVCSYKLLELTPSISLFSFLLSVVTLVGIGKVSRTTTLVATAFLIIGTLLFIRNTLPVVIIWIIVCFLKLMHLRKYSIAILLLTTSLMPGINATGSPTYTIFALMVCTISLAFGWGALEQKGDWVNGKTVILAYACCLLIVLLLRTGTNIPVISPLAKPILSEKEKTFQLESITEWVMNSSYKNYELLFKHAVDDPVKSASAVFRTHRPPTYQEYLKRYMAAAREPVNEEINPDHKLIITFGNDQIENMEPLKTVEGIFAGKAMVFQHRRPVGNR